MICRCLLEVFDPMKPKRTSSILLVLALMAVLATACSRGTSVAEADSPPVEVARVEIPLDEVVRPDVAPEPHQAAPEVKDKEPLAAPPEATAATRAGEAEGAQAEQSDGEEPEAAPRRD